MLVQSGAWRDTAWVNVVPAGTIAATTPAGDAVSTALVNLDGSGYRRVVSGDPSGVDVSQYGLGNPDRPSLLLQWEPSGERLLLHNGTTVVPRRLYVVDPSTGVVRRVLGDTPLVSEEWPSVSPDGRWIAYMERDGLERIHVVRPDGTDDRVISPRVYWGPLDWSPDGRYVIAKRYPADDDTPTNVFEIIEVDTGVRATLPFSERLLTPAWRPGHVP